MSKALVKAEALQRARLACVLIEEAQGKLYEACQQLSSLRGGAAKYSQTQNLREKVHTHWYRVHRLLSSKSLTLDDNNAQAFLARLCGDDDRVELRPDRDGSQ